MITARQFATMHGVPYTTVIFWLKKEAIPGAEKLEIAVGRQGFIWQVPQDAPLPNLPRGPQPVKKSTKNAKAKEGAPFFLASPVTSNDVTDDVAEKKTAKRRGARAK